VNGGARATTGILARYLTAAQIAEVLQVSEKSVYRLQASEGEAVDPPR